jgi:anti-sigma regulatory factor (Ser/Thr protein kinase)
MRVSAIPQREIRRGGCQSHDHVALFYEGEQEYLDGVAQFAAPALDAGEPVVAAVPPERGRLLHDSSSAVRILDMFELGRNPARIIPEVEALLAEYGGARLHVIGEPVWQGRSPEEIREVTRHEALVNLAWRDARIRSLCPYDAAALGPQVLDGAERTHPCVIRHGRGARSRLYSGGAIPSGCEQPLQLPPDSARSMRFGIDDLFKLRSMVGEIAHDAGLGDDRTADLMLVTSELSTNAIRHGDGTGVLHAWRAGRGVVCQVKDHGQIADPMAGRRRPVPRGTGGLGLWMVNQLCDLVEVRSGKRGTTVRAHVSSS